MAVSNFLIMPSGRRLQLIRNKLIWHPGHVVEVYKQLRRETADFSALMREVVLKWDEINVQQDIAWRKSKEGYDLVGLVEKEHNTFKSNALGSDTSLIDQHHPVSQCNGCWSMRYHDGGARLHRLA